MYAYNQELHLGSSLSAVEIITTILFKHLKKYDDGSKDLFILSKGHAAPALYAALIELGLIPEKEIEKIQAIDGILQGHPETFIPGIEVSSGSLGQAFSIAIGIAVALKMKNKSSKVFVLIGDGEQDEGEVWEAMNHASKLALNNLIVIIDENGYQLDGSVEEIRPKHYMPYVWLALGWEVLMCNGHDISSLDLAINKARSSMRPVVIFAKTIRNKGIKEFENTKIQKPPIEVVKAYLKNA